MFFERVVVVVVVVEEELVMKNADLMKTGTRN